MNSDGTTGSNLSPVQRALVEIREMRSKLEESERRRKEPLAIIGMGCRIPGGARSPESFWELLHNGVDAIQEIPPQRWDVNEFFDPAVDAPGKMATRWGGFIDDIDQFDPGFFNISPREAVTMDPQQRMLLEVAWEALEHACQAPDRLNESATGVFVGLSTSDYAQLQLMNGNAADIDVYFGTGGAHSVVAGRLSYILGLRGPSLAVDTACSSSLVAIHLACQSLRNQECRMALAGGVNTILLPEMTIALSKARMMASDGRCKAFDDAADGFVRSEGCGIVVLKRLSDALEDGDTILALIRGSAVNQDGRSSGLTAPNGPSQTAVIRAACDNAGVRTDEIQYVEAHGTGTSLGDPIEAQALAAALGDTRNAGKPILMGSVKTNIGHMEAAAGVGGLMKVVLALQHSEIPASLHFRTPSAHIPWSKIPVEVTSNATAWAAGSAPRRAGVSSFGFGGTNAHIILEEAPLNDKPASQPASPAEVLTLSARTVPALRSLARAYYVYLSESKCNFANVCYSANTGRAVFDHRLALVATSPAAARQLLKTFAETGSPTGRLVTGVASPCDPPESAPKAAIKEERSDAIEILNSLARSFVNGVPVNWADVYRGQPRRKVELPTYPFQRERYWHDAVSPVPVTIDSAAAWDRVVGAAVRAADVGPLDLHSETYVARWAALDRVTVAHILFALRSLKAFAVGGESVSVEELLRKCGILPVYRHLMTRWLARLEAEKIVSRGDDGRYTCANGLPEPHIEEAWQAAKHLNSDLPELLEYLERCGRLLIPVLTGLESPLETLFPNGNFATGEFLYERWALARYFNGIAAAAASAVQQSVPRGRSMRVVEIGAGTGGMTSGLLPALAAENLTYFFTDVSEAFLARASRKFADRPCLRYALLNIELPPVSQGFTEGNFDLVVAANSIHATKDLRATLENVKNLLAPGGTLLLYEVTEHLPWFEMSVGLIEGWERFEDDIRGDDPLLKPKQWTDLLTESGFVAAESLPRPGAQTEVLGHHVLIARMPGEKNNVRIGGSTNERSHEEFQIRGVEIPAAAGTPETGSSLQASLMAASEEERTDLLLDYVREHVSKVIRLTKSETLDRRSRLMDLGIDSLMAIELCSSLGEGLKLARPLPATLIFDHPTVEAVAKHLVSQWIAANPGIQPEPQKHSQLHSSRARQVAEMSDEQVELLLLEKLRPR